MSLKLNIGCGYNKMDGAINIDKVMAVRPDVICDVEYGLPFRDNIFHEIFMKHVYEHIHNVVNLMNEIWRVGKPNGYVEIILKLLSDVWGFHNLWHFYRYIQSVFKPTLVITQCSKRKLGMKTKAKYIYQGRMFKTVRELCEMNGWDYVIISAKHGLVHPDDEVTPYEKTIEKRRDIEELRGKVIPRLRKVLPRYGRVIAVLGKKYRRIVEPLSDERFVFIEGRGYGDICAKIRRLLPQSKLDAYLS